MKNRIYSHWIKKPMVCLFFCVFTIGFIFAGASGGKILSPEKVVENIVLKFEEIDVIEKNILNLQKKIDKELPKFFFNDSLLLFLEDEDRFLDFYKKVLTKIQGIENLKRMRGILFIEIKRLQHNKWNEDFKKFKMQTLKIRIQLTGIRIKIQQMEISQNDAELNKLKKQEQETEEKYKENIRKLKKI